MEILCRSMPIRISAPSVANLPRSRGPHCVQLTEGARHYSERYRLQRKRCSSTATGERKANEPGTLKRCVTDNCLRIFQATTSLSGRFCWPAAIAESNDGLPKAKVSEGSLLLSQWYPVWKRRGLAFLITSVLLALLVVSSPTNHALPPAWALTQENLVFLEAWRIIDRAYVDKSFNGQSWFRYREDSLRRVPMKTRQETYDAIRKMVGTLDDPFTRFLEPEKFKSLKSGNDGALTGVGLEVGFDVSGGSASEDLVVVSPILGGPAGRAGIVPGDIILAIDGVPTQGMGLYDAARRLHPTRGG